MGELIRPVSMMCVEQDANMCTHIHSHSHSQIHAHTGVIHRHTDAHTHTHTHTHTHSHTHNHTKDFLDESGILATSKQSWTVNACVDKLLLLHGLLSLT